MKKEIMAAIKSMPHDGCGRYVLAVSGGSDSQALLKAFPHAIADVAKFYRCEAVGVNHGLRKEADSELDLAEKLAKSVGIPFTRLQIQVPNGPNVQARARDMRYQAIRDYAGSRIGCYIVTAHHFEDRAETVLIRLLRGKKIGSLAVMPVLSNDGIFRPLLNVKKESILNYLKKFNIEYANDPSNQNKKYLRVKIRNELIPYMKNINPKIIERLNDLADEALELKK